MLQGREERMREGGKASAYQGGSRQSLGIEGKDGMEEGRNKRWREPGSVGQKGQGEQKAAVPILNFYNNYKGIL